MKKLFALLLILYFMGNPIQTTTAQTDSTSLNKQKESVIKQKIANNIDSIKTIVSEKIVQAKPTVVIQKKYYRHIVRDTIYIDTCLNSKIKYIFQQVKPEGVPQEKEQASEKLKWYQKIFKRHKKN